MSTIRSLSRRAFASGASLAALAVVPAAAQCGGMEALEPHTLMGDPQAIAARERFSALVKERADAHPTYHSADAAHLAAWRRVDVLAEAVAKIPATTLKGLGAKAVAVYATNKHMWRPGREPNWGDTQVVQLVDQLRGFAGA